MRQTRFHTLPDGRRIAFRQTEGSGPALVFLPGYMSDMAGGKACAVFDWAQAHGRSCLLLDSAGRAAAISPMARSAAGAMRCWRSSRRIALARWC